MSVMASIAGNKPVSTQNLGCSLSLLTWAWLLAAGEASAIPWGCTSCTVLPKMPARGELWPAWVTEGLSWTPAAPCHGYRHEPALNLQRLFNIDMQTPLLADPSAGCLKCHVCLLSVSPIWCFLSAHGQSRAALPLGGPAFPGCRHPGVGTLWGLHRPTGWEACTELSHVWGKVPVPQGLTKADPVFY